MRTGSRVAHLRALIDHPNTGAAERDTAQRMLARLKVDGPVGDRSYGGRHGRGGRHAGLARIAELIREDIAFAQRFSPAAAPTELAPYSPLRAAPASLVYSVDTPYEGRIDITIDGIPPEWGWTASGPSPALSALAAELSDILDEYNRDGTDIGRRFFGGVRAGETTLLF
ncbi:hypothetical protein D5S18_29805 [Nocardia panacis]|uniref:Uncharacterized protein n=1 Tax=Nocardia panacis TaxID=2340916 RepID=A0A3A4KA23_9NOCA|nr:hypothetical protein [Nocardia panacis]RJO70053.1 hypothetical protein D5S18_29805 [Nocardia panacis]